MKNYAFIFLIFLIFAGCSTIKKDIYIPNSLQESFTELDKLLPDSTKQEFAKMNEDEAVGAAHFGLGLWLRNNWGLWAGNRLNVYFNDKGIYHPDDMSSIILTSYHRYLNKKDIDVEGQIQFYQEYWAKEKRRRQEKEDAISVKGEANLKWLARNGISINSLPKANPSEIIYTCDSTLLLKRISGDTTTIWTVGGETYLDTIRAQKWVNNKGFGKTAYIKGVNYQGNIAYVMLSPKTFYTKNDSLFELDLFYRISADSMTNLNSKMFKAKNDTLKKEIRQLITDNKYKQFKLIFHPEMFENEDIYTKNIKNDSITLSNSWEADNKKYYEVTIENKLGKYDTKGVRLFDEDYKLLKYDGCNQDEIEKLKTENEIKKQEK